MKDLIIVHMRVHGGKDEASVISELDDVITAVLWMHNSPSL